MKKYILTSDIDNTIFSGETATDIIHALKDSPWMAHYTDLEYMQAFADRMKLSRGIGSNQIPTDSPEAFIQALVNLEILQEVTDMDFDDEYNYPVPDPTWDYSQIWHHCQKGRLLSEKLIKEMAEIEDANDATDNTIQDYLTDIIRQFQAALDCFPPNT